MSGDFKNLKICFLAGMLAQGGSERQLYYMIKALRECGASIHVMCLTKGEFWEGKIRELGVPVTWVGGRRSRIAKLAAIISGLKRRKPDIVQSQHIYTNLYAVAAARFLNIREIGCIRGDGIHDLYSVGGWRFLGRMSLKLPGMIAGNSEPAIEAVAAMGVPPTRLYYLPNVIDTDRFRPAADGGAGSIRIISVGRLRVEKRRDRFLAVLKKLHDRSPVPVKGIIVGDGPEQGKLQRLADDLGLPKDAVEFTGAVEDVAPLYQHADIFMSNSDWEGTPNAIMEGMAVGLPVVAGNVGGIAGIVRHGVTGWLTDPHDLEGMTEKILTLIGNREMRMQFGRHAREYIMRKHSYASLPSYLQGLYHRVLH